MWVYIGHVHGEHGMCTLPKVCGEVAYTDKEIKACKSMSELAVDSIQSVRVSVSQDRAAHPDRVAIREDDENHNSMRSCL